MRSPDLEKEMGKGIEEKMRRLMREELRVVMKKIKEVKRWREEIKESEGRS